MAKKLSFFAILQSVLASAFGVQSGKKYQQDFAQSQVVGFVVVGIVFVVLLIISLVVLANWLAG